MATPLLELELKGPLRAMGPFAGAASVLALLRWRGRPVGLLRVPAREGWVTVPQWQAALARWCQQPATRASLAEPSPLQGAAPPLSIVIATHERPYELKRCLQALAPQAVPASEIIIADSDPTSNATAALAASLAAAGQPVRYVCEPAPGLALAREAGWRAARQALVAFLADDAVPGPGWAAALGRALSLPRVAAVAGLVLPLELETPAQQTAEAWAARGGGFARREFRAPQPGQAPHAWLARAVEPLPPARAAVAGRASNLALRRDWLARVGGFDPRLQDDDGADLLARVLEAGGQVAYLPEASVQQALPRDALALQRLAFQHGAAHAGLAAKRLWEHGDPHGVLAVAGRLSAHARQTVLPRPGEAPLPPMLVVLEAAGSLLACWRFWRAARQTQRPAAIIPAYVPPRPRAGARGRGPDPARHHPA